MTRPNDQGPEELFRRMPDTGGDLQPTDQDVEAHRVRPNLGHDDAGPEGLKRRIADDPTAPDDVEGHRRGPNLAHEGGAPGAIRRIADDPTAPDDVENHLYTGGPSTRGEFIRRAPGDGPHGEG